jgi:hypothetical protein
MRLLAVSLGFVLLASSAFSQTKENQDAVETKLAALKYVQGLAVADGGFKGTADAKGPSLRGTSAGLRAVKYLGGEVANKEKHTAFVLSCFDSKTGGFADTPDGKPDVFLTSIGVMACIELGIPKEKFAKAMDYIKENAKTFEDVRIGAAAVEAWGVKDCPFQLDDWFAVAEKHAAALAFSPALQDGARDTGSIGAMYLRLGRKVEAHLPGFLQDGQREDGGWGKGKEKTSDAETTYRVMRALMLLKSKPKDPAAVRNFLATCRNKDGGFASKPGDPSTVSGTYQYAIITKWLNDMEK